MVEKKTIINFLINTMIISTLYFISTLKLFREASNNWLFWFFTTFTLATIQTIIQQTMFTDQKKSKNMKEEQLMMRQTK